MLRFIGAALLVSGVSLGVVAYRVTSRPAPAATPAGQRIAIATQDLPAGKPIGESGASLEVVSIAPDGALVDLSEVVGSSPSTRVRRGEPLLEEHFDAGGAIAAMLGSGERAVAVKIDGVVGLGGFIRPGDRVDVLLFVRRDGREVEATQARTLLHDVRVLAFGKHMEARDDTKPTLDARTAVLAVTDAEAPLLLLGDTAGKLRLALRQGAIATEGEASPGVTLNDLLPGTASSRTISTRRSAPTVKVIRGSPPSKSRSRR